MIDTVHAFNMISQQKILYKEFKERTAPNKLGVSNRLTDTTHTISITRLTGYKLKEIVFICIYKQTYIYI